MPKRKESPPPKQDKIVVVGIGASAGGLDPLKKLIAAVQMDVGVAVIIVQHHDPRHKSHLAELLQNSTDLSVRVVQGKTPIQANHIYTAPSDQFIAVADNHFVPQDQEIRAGRRLPIDFLFSAMAEALGEYAIGIILSGTGSDGSQGARDIRRAGGLVMAQDPDTSQYAEMPLSAIRAGVVDAILPPEQMPQALTGYIKQTLPKFNPALDEVLPGEDIEKIFTQLVDRTSCDFRNYKQSTIQRRIFRRMGLNQIKTVPEYVKFLRRNQAEIDLLRNDLLIGVTGFFREPEAFEALRNMVIAPLISHKKPRDTIRIWVAGCAGGQEAYSIAMICHDELEKNKRSDGLQIFASDIDERSLQVAREGLYSSDAVEDVPPHYLKKYFTKVNGDFQVVKSIREPIVFSSQNLISDPPFSKLDLISCRNVLIYLQPDIQKKIISIFAFALKPGGHLFLGKSDGVAGRDDLFTILAKEPRIYARRPSAKPEIANFPVSLSLERRMDMHGETPFNNLPKPLHLTLVNQTVLLDHYQATIVLTDTRGRILYTFGNTDRYLTFPTGEVDLNVLSMAREKLALKLRSAFQSVVQSKSDVKLKNVQQTIRDETYSVAVTLRLMQPNGWREKLVAIIFESDKSTVEAAAAHVMDDNDLVRALQEELRITKDELHTTYEEFQSSNEELKAANEEVMSMNEELQSANEELETSKEELQSINEELTTVNNQLNDKLEELSGVNNDLKNLLNASQSATLFLNERFEIKRFTPKATDLFNLIPGDINRPIEHISPKFAIADANIVADARDVLESLSTVERLVRTSQATYQMRLFPYRTVDNRIEGVVVTFQDVSQLKLIESLVQILIDGSSDAVAVLDKEFNIVHVNQIFGKIFNGAPESVVGKSIFRIGEKDWSSKDLQAALKKIDSAEPGHAFEDVIIEFGGNGRFAASAKFTALGFSAPEYIVLTLKSESTD